jgi:glycosyltransferase involved in cell wall biosynthesis
MKYGIFGNTNNYPLNFALALKSSGHEVLLIVTEKTLLHRPESIYPEFKSGYPDWIIDCSYLSEWDIISLHPDLSKILAELSTCDALILNAHGPSLLLFLNKPSIALLTGSDLSDYANFNCIEKRLPDNSNDIKSLDVIKTRSILQDFVSRQRLGISLARWVSYLPEGLLAEDDRLLESITKGAVPRGFLILSNVDKLDFTPLRHNDPIQIFCGARLTWKSPNDNKYPILDYKGGDNFIKGLGRFIRETGIPVDVHLVRKGHHVKETEDLIVQENLTNYVRWSNEMSHSDYFDAIRQSDIVIDNLGPAVPGLVTLDALAIGRPVIVNSRGYFNDKSSPPPIYEASSPNEVCEQLKLLVSSPSERERAGIAGRQFLKDYYDKNSIVNFISDKLFIDNKLTSQNKSATNNAYTYLLELRHISIFETLSKFQEQSHQQDLEKQEQTNKQLIKTITTFLLEIIGKLIHSRKLKFRIIPSKIPQPNTLILNKPYLHQGGFAWKCSLNHLDDIADTLSSPSRSPVLLFENEKPLLPGHSIHDEIYQLGEGRFSHWDKYLLFSTTDGTNPNKNGRIYTIVY